MTVYPQKYTLDCTKIGNPNYDAITMKLGNTALAHYENCADENKNSPCPGTVINSDTNTVRYTLNFTWDGITASIGSSNQSRLGDHTYQCFLDNPRGNNRTRTITIKGNVDHLHLCYHTSNSTYYSFLFSYCDQQDTYHYHCQLDCI